MIGVQLIMVSDKVFLAFHSQACIFHCLAFWYIFDFGLIFDTGGVMFFYGKGDKKKHLTLNDLNLNKLFYWINFGLKVVEHKISSEPKTKFEGTNYTWISAQAELIFEDKHFLLNWNCILFQIIFSSYKIYKSINLMLNRIFYCGYNYLSLANFVVVFTGKK